MTIQEGAGMNGWRTIDSAPRDGTWFIGREKYLPAWNRSNGVLRYHTRRTQWGKTSPVPLYGWCFVSRRGGDPEYDLWEPTHWKPIIQS